MIRMKTAPGLFTTLPVMIPATPFNMPYLAEKRMVSLRIVQIRESIIPYFRIWSMEST